MPKPIRLPRPMNGSAPATEEPESHVSFSQVPVCLFIKGVTLLLVAVLLTAALHYYLGARLIRDAGLAGPLATLAWGALGLLFLSIPLGFASSRFPSARLALAVQWVSYSWMGAFALLLTGVAASDGLLWAVGRLADAAPGERRWWGQAQAAGVWAVVAPALLFGFFSARGRPRLERVRVSISDLPPAFEGLRIVQLCDLHLGQTLRREFAEQVVEQVNALEPDLVAITGDLVDGPVRHLRPHVAPLAGLRARRGVFYVTGNHEYYHGGPAWEAEVRRLGITVLHNEHRVLEERGQALVLAGVTDHNAGQFGEEHACRVDQAFAGAPDGAPRILLAHQPRTARDAAAHRVALQLSGHTHGGQLFPWMFFVRLQQPVISGLQRIAGVLVYTSRGTGYWGPPVRLGAPAEVTELTLAGAGLTTPTSARGRAPAGSRRS